MALVSLAQRRQQPHWLYRMYDADGVLLYIGQTSNPVGRFTAWLGRACTNRRPWVLTVTRVDWRRYPNHDAVVAAEKLAIETERPIHNRDHQPRRVA